MTLNGYYFTATGVTEYAFFHGDNNTLAVFHDALPDAPVRIRIATDAAYTLSRPGLWPDALPDGEMPAPGASYPFLDAGSAEAGRLYILGLDHFAVAVPGAALTGRIVHERPRRSVILTGMDDELVARMEYGLERILSREQFGEWFPRRYVADVTRQPGEPLLGMALSVPFLGFDAYEIR